MHLHSLLKRCAELKKKYMAEKTQMIITGIICLVAIIGTIKWIKKSYSSGCKIGSKTCDNCPLKSTNCNKNKKV